MRIRRELPYRSCPRRLPKPTVVGPEHRQSGAAAAGRSRSATVPNARDFVTAAAASPDTWNAPPGTITRLALGVPGRKDRPGCAVQYVANVPGSASPTERFG